MIQRVQSLFLLGAVILLTLVMFFPVWSNQGSLNGNNVEVTLTAFDLSMTGEDGTLVKEEATVYSAAIALLSAITALFAIFRFKQRKTQLKLGRLNILLILLLIISFVYPITTGQSWLGTQEAGNFKISFFLPILALILVFLANHYIKKDEKLVRSMDRLR